jgi:hypothetical protein
MKAEKKKELFSQWESEFYDKYAYDANLQEELFRSLAIGFFVAKGCNINDSFAMYNYCKIQGKF